jgi:hypothetical protein
VGAYRSPRPREGRRIRIDRLLTFVDTDGRRVVLMRSDLDESPAVAAQIRTDVTSRSPTVRPRTSER